MIGTTKSIILTSVRFDSYIRPDSMAKVWSFVARQNFRTLSIITSSGNLNFVLGAPSTTLYLHD